MSLRQAAELLGVKVVELQKFVLVQFLRIAENTGAEKRKKAAFEGRAVMRMLTKKQLNIMNDWMQANARPYDRAKWNYLFNGGSKDTIVEEMLKYQNADGGMGSGFEADMLCPLPAAIPTAEAIFQAYEYELDCSSAWFKAILNYFERSVQNIPKYWEDSPKEAMDYPHAPWWNYEPCMVFNPNPCAVVASAMICNGTDSQKELGYKIADDCISFLLGKGFCGDHDTFNIQALVLQIKSPLISAEVMESMRRRILENTCFDTGKYNGYFFTPLDFVSSPNSIWYGDVKHGIERTFDFWLNNINEQGVWNPNFSWGIDSDVSRRVTENWKGYITVKRAKIFLNFDRIER